MSEFILTQIKAVTFSGIVGISMLTFLLIVSRLFQDVTLF